MTISNKKHFIFTKNTAIFSVPKFLMLGLLLHLLFFEMTFHSCKLGWSAVASSQLTATSASQVQVVPLPQPPK